MEELQQFGSLSVAHRTGGAPVELLRSADEVVFLAFDNRIRRLVELHVLRGGGALDAASKRSAFERARQASEIRGHSFMRILEVGEDQGLVYYTSNLNDGEFAEEYVKRRGALSASTALAMIYQLLDDLLQLQGFERLVSHMRLDRVLITTLEDTFLQLRVFDYGLSQTAAADEARGRQRLVAEACRLLFLLLTGQPHCGENPDKILVLTQLPMSLRITVRTALTDPDNAPSSVEKLRDDVREAFSALASGIQARNLRKHLVVNGPLMPQSQLQELLLENVPVETILGTRFRVEDVDHARRYPFSIPAVNVKADQPVTVHLLPPSRIVEKTRYEAVPLQMWRFNPDRHPNILRSLSLWESPDWTFLTEEREPGFALSRLMAERITLNPPEVLVLMRQVRAGLEQAVECGVQRVDLHPSNILLRVGKNGPLLARELERLMQKRLDAWPHFIVKLRPHMTMRSLYEPLLVDMDLPESPQMEEHLQNRDFRHRSFIALAAYLLTGERQSGGTPQFSEAIPDAAANYVRECLDLARRAGKAPPPAEFIEKFEGLLTAPTVDLATRLRGSAVALEEMESAGSVSDFEDDWSEGSAGMEEDEMISPVRRGMKAHDFSPLAQQKSSMPWAVLAAAVVVMLAGAGWMLWGGAGAGPETPVPAVSAAKVSEAEKPDAPGAVPAVTPAAAPDKSSPKPSVAAAPAPSQVSGTKPSPEAKGPKLPASPPPAPRPVAITAAPQPKPQPQPAPVVANLPSPKPPPAQSSSPAAASAPQPAPSPSPPPSDAVTAGASASTPPAPSAPEKSAPPPAVAPPAPSPPEKAPVTIRRAIVPTKEEIERMKQGHVQNQTDTLPAVSTASPLPPKRSENP